MRKPLRTIALLIGILFWTVPAPASQSLVYVIKIDDYIINPVVAQYIRENINLAEKEKAQCLIIELDTPGGLLSSTRNIVKDLMNANLPIVVYVSPQGARAGSAGVFITLAAHLSVMAPSTNIGAAHPVEIQEKKSTGENIKEIFEVIFKKDELKEEVQKDKTDKDVMTEKITNDTLAWVSTLAQNRGRNVEWARKAVTESVSITEDEAVKLGVVNFIAEDLRDLLKKIDGVKVFIADKEITLDTEDANLITRQMTLRDKILNVIANPTIAYLLMVLGFYGLLFEFTHPGIGFPGIAGFISIIMAFYGLHMLPTNYAGIALIILAVILFVAEAQMPGFGLLALGGIICMLLGSLILFNSPYEMMYISLKIIVPVTLATALIFIFLAGAVIRTHRGKIKSGQEGLIGETGESLSAISPEGKVFIHGEIWNAKSAEPIEKNSKVEVYKIDGMTLWVKKRKGD